MDYKILKETIWKAYPPAELDEIMFLYYENNKCKVIPFSIFYKFPIIHDKVNKTTICFCRATKSVSAIKGLFNVKKKEPVLILEDNDKNEFNILQKNKTIVRYESYVCTLDECLLNFNDCIYLTPQQNIPSLYNTFIEPIFHIGVIYNSKQMDKNGIHIQKKILLKGNFKNILKWISRNKSAISEKNGLIIPTSYKGWNSIHHKFEYIELVKNKKSHKLI